MQYEIFGRSDNRPPVVLSAGLGGMGTFWRPQYDSLAADQRVISYDHRGTGANQEPLPDDYAIANMADDVVSILDQSGSKTCHFMGHALGGLVGLELALRHPDRVRSLILVNAWPKIDSSTERCFAMRLALLEHAGVEAYVRAQPIFLYPSWWLSQHRDKLIRDDAHGVETFQGATNLLKRIRALSSYDASTELAHIQVPTLVAAARDDVLVPYTSSLALSAAIPGSRLSVAAEGGHAFSVTNAASFNGLVTSFLAEVSARA